MVAAWIIAAVMALAWLQWGSITLWGRPASPLQWVQIIAIASYRYGRAHVRWAGVVARSWIHGRVTRVFLWIAGALIWVTSRALARRRVMPALLAIAWSRRLYRLADASTARCNAVLDEHTAGGP